MPIILIACVVGSKQDNKITNNNKEQQFELRSEIFRSSWVETQFLQTIAK